MLKPGDTASSRQMACLFSSASPMVLKCQKSRAWICNNTPPVEEIVCLQSGFLVQACWQYCPVSQAGVGYLQLTSYDLDSVSGIWRNHFWFFLVSDPHPVVFWRLSLSAASVPTHSYWKSLYHQNMLFQSPDPKEVDSWVAENMTGSGARPKETMLKCHLLWGVTNAVFGFTALLRLMW